MILKKIIDKTRIRIEKEKNVMPIDKLKSQLTVNTQPFAFEKALKSNDLAFICEVKKASPSKGILCDDFPYIKIACDYENAGARAISVLTEPDFFMGSNLYLQEIKQHVSIPILRKDFIIDEYQIYEASLIGADAILLICAVLETETIRKFIELADSLGLSSLVEAHDEMEVKEALHAGARVIGVNNRNLKTFEVDIQNSINLRKLIPSDKIFVSESGISTKEHIMALKQNGTDAVLMGETFMKSTNIKMEMAKLCGN